MRSFWRQLLGEVGLGWRRAVRGPLVIALVGTMAGLIFGLPYRAEASGARLGYAMSLSWTLTLVCALWCGVASYAYDRERHRMALVFTKPLRAWTLWVGRWLGTAFPFVVMMGALYGMLWGYDFPSGAHRLQPQFPSVAEVAREELQVLREQGLDTLRIKEEQGVSEARLLEDIERNIVRRYTELAEGGTLTYTFAPLAPQTREVRFCLSGVPFMGAYNERMMAITATLGEAREALPIALTARGVEASLPAGWQYDGKTPLVIEMKRVVSFHEAGYIMFREREDIQLFYAGYPPRVNMLMAVIVMTGVVLMAVALGCALGARFSLPVGVFVGTLSLLVAAIASVDVTVTVTQELQSLWTYLGARISDLVAGPFRGIVTLDPITRLLEGVSLPWREVGFFWVGTWLPWVLICSLCSLGTSVKDEDL